MRPLVIVINRLSVGGAERLVVDELHELHRRGIEVHLVTLFPEGRSSLLPQLNIPTQCVHINASFLALLRLLRALKPQAVICHLWYANMVGRVAARLAGIKRVVVFEHNVYDRVKSRAQFFVDWLLQGLATNIIAVSETVQGSLVHHGISPTRIRVLPNAIDPRRYLDAVPADLAQAYRLPHNAFILLLVGRLTHQKGFDICIRAMPLLPEHVHAILLGIGEEEKTLKELARALSVQERVHFGGVRYDMPNVLKASHCLVMPSRWEGEPIILLEALAAGVPVVGSDIPPLRALITESVNGFLAPVNDVSGLARALSRIVSTNMSTVVFPSNRTITRHIDGLKDIVGYKRYGSKN